LSWKSGKGDSKSHLRKKVLRKAFSQFQNIKNKTSRNIVGSFLVIVFCFYELLSSLSEGKVPYSSSKDFQDGCNVS